MAINLRAMVLGAMLGDYLIEQILSTRIYQYGAVPPPSEIKKPYAVIKLGLETPEPNWRNGPTHRPFQVWVHDDPGDFDRIDAVLAQCKLVLPALTNQDDFFEIRFIDNTQDLDDPQLNDILRYSRYLAKFKN